MYKVEKYRTLEDVPGKYAALFDKVGKDKFFLSLPWFKNLERTVVAQDERLFLYGVEDGEGADHPVGLLPLWKRRHQSFLAPRVLQGLANYYSPYFAPIIGETESAKMAEVVRCCMAAVRGDWNAFDVVELRPVEPGSPVFHLMVEELKRLGLVVQTYFHFGNWYLDVKNRSYEQYVASLGSVLRKNIPYQTRRLERTYQTDIVLVTSTAGLDKALEAYEMVYGLSWRDREEHPKFIRGLARTAAEEGGLRLAILYAAGTPVAAQLWIVYGGVASIYKICYDQNFAKFSVGTVLTAYMMRHVLDVDKVQQVDYLSGDDSYKKEWMSDRREFWGILAFNPRTVRGMLQIGRHVGGRWVSRRVTSFCNKFKGKSPAKVGPDGMTTLKTKDPVKG